MFSISISKSACDLDDVPYIDETNIIQNHRDTAYIVEKHIYEERRRCNLDIP